MSVRSLFVLQGIAMGVDEVVCHRARGLSRWERIGHPLDTATALACYAFLALAPPTRRTRLVYGALAVFSSAFVMKDVKVHAQHCSRFEQRLHALLYLLHPGTLLAAGRLWQRGRERSLLRLQVPLVAGFLLHQLLYWNGPWRRR